MLVAKVVAVGDYTQGTDSGIIDLLPSVNFFEDHKRNLEVFTEIYIF